MHRREFLKNTASGVAAVALTPELSQLFPPMPQGDPLRIGLVGVGKRGRRILEELAKIDAASVVAVCDIDEKRLNGATKRAPGAEAYSHHPKMLENTRDLDAVIVATPTFEHAKPTMDALEARKHVFCEAPLAGTAEDCTAIAQAAQSAKGMCAVGYTARSNPVYQLARSFFRSGSARKLVAVEAQSHRKTSWRTHGGSGARDKRLNWRLHGDTSRGLPGEMASHAVDVMTWFTKRNPVSVAGSGATLLRDDGREIHDTVTLDFELPKQTRMSYRATLANSFESEHVTLYGTHGTFKLAGTHAWLFKEADAPTAGWEVYAHRQRFHNDEGITLIADATQLASQGKLEEGIGLPHPPLYYALLDFVRAARKDKKPACSAADAVVPTVAGIRAQEAVLSGERLILDTQDDGGE